jgi:hypothetical protein
MKERVENLKHVCTPADADELTVIHEAYSDTLARYKTDHSASRARDYEAAKKALVEILGTLEAKYFDSEKPYSHRKEVLAFLKNEGYKIEKTKLYADASKGLLRVQADQTVRRSDVRDYIIVAGLKQIKKKNGDITEDQAEKIRKENLKLDLTNEKLEFELDLAKEKYVLKSDVQTEIAVKIGAMESGFKHLVRLKAADWIYAVGGEPNKSGVLTDLMYAGFDELLNEFGNMDELKVTVKKMIAF